MKLAIVGGAPYADDYIRQVWRTADPRVVFPGYVFGRGYWELQRHAYLFCAPTEVGGTHPVILEAMAAGNCVLVNDHPPNVETVGDAGVYFSRPGGRRGPRGAARAAAERPAGWSSGTARARSDAPASYSWEAITDEYERLLVEVCAARGHGPLPPSLLDCDARVAEPQSALGCRYQELARRVPGVTSRRTPPGSSAIWVCPGSGSAPGWNSASAAPVLRRPRS